MTVRTTEGGVGLRRCSARTTYDDDEEDNDGQVRCNIRGDPSHFGTTMTTMTMVQTLMRTSRAYVSSACMHATDATHKQFWLCNPTAVEGSDCFAMRTITTREGVEFNTTTTTMMTTMMTPTTTAATSDAQQLHKVKIKKSHNMPIFLHLPSCRRRARRHANPSNINLIFMDVMCCDVGRMA